MCRATHLACSWMVGGGISYHPIPIIRIAYALAAYTAQWMVNLHSVKKCELIIFRVRCANASRGDPRALMDGGGWYRLPSHTNYMNSVRCQSVHCAVKDRNALFLKCTCDFSALRPRNAHVRPLLWRGDAYWYGLSPRTNYMHILRGGSNRRAMKDRLVQFTRRTSNTRSAHATCAETLSHGGVVDPHVGYHPM
jgi:hypothetical protein